MKFVVHSARKSKKGAQSGNDAIVECTKSARRNLLADIVSIGILILITGAILGIPDPLPKKGATRQLEPAEVKAQNIRQDALDVGSRPASLDPPETTTSDDLFRHHRRKSQPSRNLLLRRRQEDSISFLP